MVIDMQKGFMAPGGTLYCGDEAMAIVPRIRERLARARGGDTAVFFTQDTHDPQDREFDMFPPHCLRGSPEVEIIDELQAFAEGARRVPKRRYSAFFGTDLEDRLRAVAPEEVVVMGVCTDICVLHTVADLRNRDYAVEVPADCVASFDPEQHEWALVHMERILGARITGRKRGGRG